MDAIGHYPSCTTLLHYRTLSELSDTIGHYRSYRGCRPCRHRTLAARVHRRRALAAHLHRCSARCSTHWSGKGHCRRRTSTNARQRAFAACRSCCAPARRRAASVCPPQGSGPSEGWMTSLRRGWIWSVVKSTVANISIMFHVNSPRPRLH